MEEDKGSTEENSPGFLDMSDEAFLAEGDQLLDSLPDEDPADAGSSDAEEGADNTDHDDDDPASEEQDDDDDEGADSDDEAGSDENSRTYTDGDDDDSDSDTGDDTSDADDDTSESDDTVDYQAEYEKVLAPFTANGKQIKVDNVEDAIQLMQKGANYNKKMSGLKPVMALVKMLEKNNLADEGKLGFLIDVSKNDPTAIAKLLKDNEINPLEMDIDDAGEYKAKDHSVDPREIDLDEVLEDLKSTPTFSKTIDTVDNWDPVSKQAVANDPQLLRHINDQVSNGVYDVINTAVESERMFGRLQGMSDIEAYQTVGQALQKTGGFDHIFHKEDGQQKISDLGAKSNKGNDQKRRDKRKAASQTKTSAAKKKKVDSTYNPLALSDEEFMAAGDSKYM